MDDSSSVQHHIKYVRQSVNAPFAAVALHLGRALSQGFFAVISGSLDEMVWPILMQNA
jgi:hypothetical protein